MVDSLAVVANDPLPIWFLPPRFHCITKIVGVELLSVLVNSRKLVVRMRRIDTNFCHDLVMLVRLVMLEMYCVHA